MGLFPITAHRRSTIFIDVSFSSTGPSPASAGQEEHPHAERVQGDLNQIRGVHRRRFLVAVRNRADPDLDLPPAPAISTWATTAPRAG
jgi:hypothetical protein